MRILNLKSVIVGMVLLICSCTFSGEWLDNFENAKAAAKKGNKYILANFTGSDWCPWCMKLEKEVFNTPEFKKYANENLILFIADFPRKKVQSVEVKKQNEKLMKNYNVQGFPTVLLLTSDGETVFTTGYQAGGPKTYVGSLKKAIDSYKIEKTAKQKNKYW